MILLVAAFIIAWLFRWHIQRSAGRGTSQRCRRAGRVSLLRYRSLWAAVVICGRFIAYDWFDCGQDNPRSSTGPPAAWRA